MVAAERTDRRGWITACIIIVLMSVMAPLTLITCIAAGQQLDRVSISLDPSNPDPNGSNQAPAISSNGRLVAFDSAATNLVPVDEGVFRDIFLRDRGSYQTETRSGRPAPSVAISAACSRRWGFTPRRN